MTNTDSSDQDFSNKSRDLRQIVRKYTNMIPEDDVRLHTRNMLIQAAETWAGSVSGFDLYAKVHCGVSEVLHD